ncbi:hypothetical protein KKB98_02900 [Patescibacteria group bacterium]|nr:hypothetical protein [Patescibacteria group bacterium]MCG2809817.1 hypothetical protein [Candidatus Portnoybacteria bacterium]
MDKTKAKVFTIFWFVSGVVWTFASVKRFTAGEDITIAVVYAATAIIAFALALGFYRKR